MAIQLSDHFTFGKLFRFTAPTIGAIIVVSLYSMVDGFFVSNFVSKTAFAAVNLVMPFLTLLGTIGIMIGTGGSALVAKTRGEGDAEKANDIFSLLVTTALVMSSVLAILALIGVGPVAQLLGASGDLLEQATLYGRICAIGIPFLVLQDTFQSFFATAEKPKLGLVVTISAGVINILLDALFIIVFGWGLAGAAIATVIGEAVGGFLPLAYFILPNKTWLRVRKPHFDGAALKKTFINGSSELMTNMAMSIVGMLYNYQLMQYLGENGVAAYGVIMYAGYIFFGILYGYSAGISPAISYHFGARNTPELQNLFKKSLAIMGSTGLILVFILTLVAPLLAQIFVGYDQELVDITLHGVSLYKYCLIFMGFSIFGSALFTALNNGPVSAFVSFVRTMICETSAVMLLPLVLGADGIWLSVVVAEIVSVCVTAACIIYLRGTYHYF